MRVLAYLLPWRKPFLIEGPGSLKKLPERVLTRRIKSILLVISKSVMSMGLADTLIKSLNATGIKTFIYSETVPNPTIENIEDALTIYNQNNCDGIIAIGGGSVIDCAKGVGIRVVRPRTMIPKMKGLLKVIKRIPPLFAVPTTSGTGSEATLATVVVDNHSGEKYALTDPAIFPYEAVLDPLLTIGLPPAITATTGMDTLTHAVEAYIGNSNTHETKEMARQTVKLVFENLYIVYKDGKNVDARANMQKAAYYGGLSFTRAYVGNVHAIAHTLGGMYNVPHGLANAVILPYVLDAYGETVYKKLAQLAEFIDLPDALSASEEIKAKAFIQAIRDLNKSMNIGTTINEINNNDIPIMAKRAFHEANPVYPVPQIFTLSDFINIYNKLIG